MKLFFLQKWRALAAISSLGLLAGCAGGVAAPEWQSSAQDALRLATTAFLSGNDKVAQYGYAKAYNAVAQTGRGDLLGRIELVQCASRVATLVFAPCTGFERLRQDAAPAERAYAAFLAGTPAAPDIPLLPAQYQPIAAAGSRTDLVSRLRAIADPLSRLIAAGVLVRQGRASADVLALAADTASAQGWPRPLLAWLEAQALLAQRNGDPDQAARLRHRIELVTSK